jgi:hypothetical protein
MNTQVSAGITQQRELSRRRRRALWALAAVALLGLAATVRRATVSAAAAPAAVAVAGEHSMKCYSEEFDSDGDGYARLSEAEAQAASRTFSWSGKGRVNCPRGYVRFYGDCDDGDPNVNPGKGEVGFNGKDDNCNGVIDEPTFVYYPEGNRNTTYNFRLTVNLNSQAITDHLGHLFAEIEYAALRDSGNTSRYGKVRVNQYSRQNNVAHLTLTVGDSATAYRARVTFFRRLDSGQFEQVGGRSDWYYTMTDGEIEKTQKRARMVWKGLAEYGASLDGEVGYRGTADVDGTRYGADSNELWCSEFYSWVTKAWLRGFSRFDTVEEAVDYFRGYDTYFAPSDVPQWAAPGDYLALDTNDDGRKNHSAMFLAYEREHDRVWTLEGNSGNKVKVRKRGCDLIIGLGHIARAQLE